MVIEVQNLTRNRAKEKDKWLDMKKYTKLVLVVTALLSTLCFLFYKFRYDRLYNVLQVLEVFGTPDDPSFKDCEEKSVIQRPISLPPTWQRVDDSLYLFSAYCEKSSDQGQGCPLVTAIAIASEQPINLKCKLWFEGSLKALEGIFSATKDLKEDPEGQFSPFTLKCESKFNTRVPYAMTVYKDGGHESQVPIQFLEELNDKSPLNICILHSSLLGDSTLELRESLIFHSFVNASSLRLYSGGFSSSVMQTIHKLEMDRQLSLAIVSWNIPTSLPLETVVRLATSDCYFQSRHNYLTYVVLTPRQILMPKSLMTLPDTVKVFSGTQDVVRGPNPLLVKKFCAEYPEDKQSKNFAARISLLQSTFYNQQLSDGVTSNIHFLGDVTGKEEHKKEDILNVNEYGGCERYDFKETDKTAVYESDALRFSKGLLEYFKKYK